MNEMKISSPSFSHETIIPRKFTCQGKDINPEFIIEGVPENTNSLVLIMDDPDAPMGTWDHWVVWNIEPTVSKIGENSTPKKGVIGKNSWGKNSYGGPCPPSGTHRYYFKLYALDIEPNLPTNTRKKDVEKAMKGHIITEAVLMGKYQKR
jgi:Raf kinase inhibitor-like YbhB/YbcL family protein